MRLFGLEIVRLRILSQAKLEPSAGANLLVGPNASGKTSIIEAIHVLASGRSFRTPRLDSVIQHRQAQCQVHAHYLDNQGRAHRVGLQRENKITTVRRDGEPVHNLSQLALSLPIHLIQPETHFLLEQGPRFRRQFLDWGVFHVEQAYLSGWQGYHRTLRQRNALLRQHAGSRQVHAWDTPLLEQGKQLHRVRAEYIQRLQPHFERLATELLGQRPSILYLPGWPGSGTYELALQEALTHDLNRGFTTVGPHRADLSLHIDGQPVQTIYSRGQQKLLVAALRLAHFYTLKERGQDPGIILVDDLPAELDRDRRGQLLAVLKATQAQLFITATDSAALEPEFWPERKVFHVERGCVTEVI
ncbi:MAG: DNA replication/repair protein RecF [Gammaproteobacteria bacterium]|nr:DNA replication/repair protein RecF [Gammaproteobacteria bacterium]